MQPLSTLQRLRIYKVYAVQWQGDKVVNDAYIANGGGMYAKGRTVMYEKRK